ncbi:protein preY, mitochondrial [Etheostoma spectabile]|uniref:protein preY, mitochondrial n=1 Tax=Etheostoma spectabile TaxID=54343 RepID=UPI0013AF5A97|nr:protein preY, mitochondrial [Etheostoma spectabile]
MFGRVFGRLLTETVRGPSGVKHAPLAQRAASARGVSDLKDEAQPPFDTSLLHFLVCPLSKKPLRYEANTNELINDELGIAYSISNGIPNMIPQEARLLQKDGDTSAPPTHQ